MDLLFYIIVVLLFCAKYQDANNSYTNQYKDVIAQREFSASEARSLIAPALKTFTTSLLFATNEEQSRTRFKLVNTASDALKLAFQACFSPAYSSVEWLSKGVTIPSFIRLE